MTDNRAGMLAMCAAMLLLPLGDSLTKLLTGIAPPLDVTVWRNLSQALFFVPVALIFRRHVTGRVIAPVTLLSGALVATILFSLISAFEHMPIATAIAIFFIEPLLLTVLAGPLLGEVAGPRRYAAVAVGLIGALVVIRPNFSVFGPVVLFPVVAAFAFALNMIVTRKATRTRSPLAFQLGTTWCATAILVTLQIAAALFGREPAPLIGSPPWVWAAIVAAGVLAAGTFLLITYAFSAAEASVLAPLQYLEIVGATIVGFLVFGDFPDAMTWLGTAIILASGIYVIHRERQAAMSLRARQPRANR